MARTVGSQNQIGNTVYTWRAEILLEPAVRQIGTQFTSGIQITQEMLDDNAQFVFTLLNSERTDTEMRMKIDCEARDSDNDPWVGTNDAVGFSGMVGSPYPARQIQSQAMLGKQLRFSVWTNKLATIACQMATVEDIG